MVAPLEGIKVVEVANWLAAPASGAIMRDLGADVIKVEPPAGDVLRGFPEVNFPGKYETSPYFESDNRGKRSIAIALDHPEGPGVVHALIRDADIFITNLTKSRMVRYKLTAEDVNMVNPRVVHVSLTGYGPRGPEADRPGFDFAAFWARSGIMGLIGEPGGSPLLCRPGQGDHTTSLNLLGATLAALRLRDLTEEGQQVEVTLQGTGIWTIANDITMSLMVPEQPKRHDREHPINPLWNTYEMADKRWVLLVMPASDSYWPPFCEMLNVRSWITDPRYDTLRHRSENSEELTHQVAARFIVHDSEYWAAQLDKFGMIWAPVAEIPEVTKDPQLAEMGAFTHVESAKAGSQKILNTPFTIRNADVSVRGRAPTIGEHTADVLFEAGMTSDDVSELAAKGVFG